MHTREAGRQGAAAVLTMSLVAKRHLTAVLKQRIASSPALLRRELLRRLVLLYAFVRYVRKEDVLCEVCILNYCQKGQESLLMDTIPLSYRVWGAENVQGGL
jgi:hypothetical protein